MSLTPQFVLSLVVLVLSAVIVPSSAALQRKHFCYTTATLLPGGLTSCENTSSTACTGGTPSAQAYVREMENRGEPVATLFLLDTFTAFAQMHPDSWDVNKRFLQRYNWRFWSGEINIFGDTHTFSTLLDSSIPGVVTNHMLNPSSQWYGYAKTSHVDLHTGIGFFAIFNTHSPVAFDWRLSALRALQNLARDPNVKHVIAFCHNAQIGNSTELVQELQNISPIKIDGIFNVEGNFAETESTQNGSYVITSQSSQGRGGVVANNLVCMNFDTDTTSDSFVAAARTTQDLHALPASLKDAAYDADVLFARDEARTAVSNNPIVGYTSAMPVAMDGTFRPCMGGVCAMGALWTDSFVWKADVDIAFQNSGGVRGPGWPAGPVRVANLWESMPWPNTLCNASLLGLSVWEMLNNSFSMPLSETYYTKGQFFLQYSGLRVEYNMDLSPSRIVSVDVFDKATDTWKPLDRLKLYHVAIPNYECYFVPPYSDIMNNKRYTGETTSFHDTTGVIHGVVEEYLRATTSASAPKTLSFADRAVITTKTQPLAWVESQVSCAVDTYWESGIATCLPCPEGLEQPLPAQDKCQAIVVEPAEDRKWLAVAIAVPVSLLVIGVAVVAVLLMRTNPRDVANAPKQGRATIVFTDIQSSTKLWSIVPRSMSASLDKHHAIVRAAITKHRAYEVKNIGDGFMIATACEDDAIRLAVEIQRNLLRESWPSSINEFYAADNEDDLYNIDDEPDQIDAPPHGGTDLRGVRVRIGMHSGEPTIVLDETTKSYDYYGPMVNVASRVEAAASGGQVCCTDAVLSMVDQSHHHDLIIQNVGKRTLKGVNEEVELSEVLPKERGSSPKWASPRPSMKAAGRVDLHTPVGPSAASPTPVGPSTTCPVMELRSADDTCTDVDGSVGSLSYDDTVPDAIIIAKTNLVFFVSLLGILNPTDARRIRKLMLQAWRISDDPHAEQADLLSEKDKPLHRLCKRATLFSTKALRKSARETSQITSNNIEQMNNASLRCASVDVLSSGVTSDTGEPA